MAIYCHNCTVEIDTEYAKAIRGCVLCPGCRTIEKEMHECTQELVTLNHLEGLARLSSQGDWVYIRITERRGVIRDRLNELDYQLAERILAATGGDALI